MHTIYDVEGNRNRQDAQRLSDQQATIIARLIAREVVLHNALSAAVERIVNQFGVGYDATDIDMWEAARGDGSPQADALVVVLGLMDRWQETAFKSDWESVDEDLFAAWDAYRAITPDDDPARGPHVEPRGPGGDG